MEIIINMMEIVIMEKYNKRKISFIQIVVCVSSLILWGNWLSNKNKKFCLGGKKEKWELPVPTDGRLISFPKFF